MAMSHAGQAGVQSGDDGFPLIAADLDHGRKLYELSCAACHKANVHWRDKRLADSWTALLHQVDKWQRQSGQKWDAMDVNDVAAYLNDRFYKLQCPAQECAGKQAASPAAVDAR